MDSENGVVWSALANEVVNVDGLFLSDSVYSFCGLQVVHRVSGLLDEYCCGGSRDEVESHAARDHLDEKDVEVF